MHHNTATAHSYQNIENISTERLQEINTLNKRLGPRFINPNAERLKKHEKKKQMQRDFSKTQ
jgi:hypothetical protein